MIQSPVIDIETKIIERLSSVFTSEFPDIQVLSAPGDEEEKYAAGGYQGALLVRFNVERPVQPPQMETPFGAQQTQQTKKVIEYVVICAVGSDSPDNTHHNALNYIHCAKMALSGYKVELNPVHHVKLRTGESRILRYENFIWFYYLVIETEPF